MGDTTCRLEFCVFHMSRMMSVRKLLSLRSFVQLVFELLNVTFTSECARGWSLVLRLSVFTECCVKVQEIDD